MSDETPRVIVLTPEQVEALLASLADAGTARDRAPRRVRERFVLEKFDKTHTSAPESELEPVERLVFEDGRLIERTTRPPAPEAPPQEREEG